LLAVCRFLEIQANQGKSLSDVVDNMTSDDIGRHLYAADLPDPDLIIRTSGEIRLSGFLLWQIAQQTNRDSGVISTRGWE
jgi:short-chain Z-isoprenyl diphosphate synthase